jgi:hypothetical protein
VDPRKDHDVRRALAPLAAVAERTGAAVQLVRHLSKSEGKNPVYRGGGSIGIIGAARMGSLVAIDPKDEERRVLAPVKNNLAVHPRSLIYTLEEAANGAVRVVWVGESEYSASELLQSVRPDRADARREAEAFLVSLLSDDPVPKTQVEEEARAANISDSTLRRAKSSLGVIPERERTRSVAREAWDAGCGGSPPQKHRMKVFSSKMFNALRDEAVDTLNGPGAMNCRNLAQVRRISKMLRHLLQSATSLQVSTLNEAPSVGLECCSRWS